MVMGRGESVKGTVVIRYFCGTFFGGAEVVESSEYLDFAFDETTPDRARLVDGDSGSPSFIVDGRGGEMYFSGAHYGIYNEGTVATIWRALAR